MRHLAAGFNVARWILKNDQDAEDVVQDSVVKAYQAFPRFKGADAKPWFLKIVRNGCFRILERSKNRAIEEHPDDLNALWCVADPNDPEAQLLKKADGDTVRCAIEALPDAFREVIVLREFEQLSYAEISDIVGCPAGTVMSRLSRARALLAISLRTANL